MRAALSRSLLVRTLVAGLLFALLLSGAFGVLVVAVESQKTAGRAALRSQEAITAGTELEKTAVSLDSGVRGFVASGRDRALAPFTAGRAAYRGQVARVARLVREDPRQAQIVERIGTEIGDYVDLWALPLVDVARDHLDYARNQVLNVNGRERIDAIRSDFAELFRRARGLAAARVARAEARSRLAVALGIGGILLVLGVTLGAVAYLRRSIVRPVRRVAAASGEVAAGRLEARVPEDRADELGALARDFNSMTRSLEESRRELAARTAELERSNSDLEDYASVAAHDLKGPLVTISMYAELIRRKLAEREPEGAELAGHIGTSATQLQLLVRDLLTYGRIGQGGLRWEDVALDEVLDEVLANLAGPLRDGGATVRRDPALPVVRGDRRRLGQLLQNLVGNAIKFSGDDPVVEVRCARDGDEVRLSVIDHGIGFDPTRAEYIFRPFSRLDTAAGREGSGIGLAICDRIATLHEGRIWAESTPGEGSAFHVVLLAAAARPAGRGDEAADPAATAA